MTSVVCPVEETRVGQSPLEWFCWDLCCVDLPWVSQFVGKAESPSLEVFRDKLSWAWSSLVEWKGVPALSLSLWKWSWNGMIIEAPSHPNHSGVLWCPLGQCEEQGPHWELNKKLTRCTGTKQADEKLMRFCSGNYSRF